MRIEPAAGFLETAPETGFIRTTLRQAPTHVNMARALMGHALAVVDELESLTEAEFVELCAAFVPLSKKMASVPARVAWNRPAQHEPED